MPANPNPTSDQNLNADLHCHTTASDGEAAVHRQKQARVSRTVKIANAWKKKGVK